MKVSMIGNCRADSPCRHVSVGLLAVGAAVAAAVIGAGAARADDTDALGFLDSSATDLTDAKDVLSTAVVPDEWQSTLSAQTQLVDFNLGVIDKFEGVQDPLLTSHDTVIAEIANVLFSGSDQRLAQASEAVLSADKAFVADPSPTTDSAELGPELQLTSAVIDQAFPDDLARVADQLLGLGSADTTGAGAASAASDPAFAAAADPASGSVTAGDLLTQAGTELTQTAHVLDSAPTASLDVSQSESLSGAEGFLTGDDLQSLTSSVESLQADLPAADQPAFIDLDSGLLKADTGFLDAAQGFASADQAGDLTNSSALSLDLASLGAVFDTFNVDFASSGVALLGVFDPSLLAAF